MRADFNVTLNSYFFLLELLSAFSFLYLSQNYILFCKNTNIHVCIQLYIFLLHSILNKLKKTCFNQLGKVVPSMSHSYMTLRWRPTLSLYDRFSGVPESKERNSYVRLGHDVGETCCLRMRQIRTPGNFLYGFNVGHSLYVRGRLSECELLSLKNQVIHECFLEAVFYM